MPCGFLKKLGVHDAGPSEWPETKGTVTHGFVDGFGDTRSKP
jgi:hypothetical protein